MNNSDALVVYTADLSKYMIEWREKWLADRPLRRVSTGANAYGKLPLFVGPMQYLAQESGMSERSLNRVIACETKVTMYALAERIVLAMNMPGLISPGGPIPVVANPGWSEEKWLAYMEERGCV
jgi:hypothetical protein